MLAVNSHGVVYIAWQRFNPTTSGFIPEDITSKALSPLVFPLKPLLNPS